MPVMPELAEELKNQPVVESSFYASLAQLIRNLGLDLADDLYSHLPYPYNVLRVVDEVNRQLFSLDSRLTADFTQIEASGEVALVTYQYYQLQNRAHFLPIKSLYEQVIHAPRAPETLLLLSIYAFLYQVADVRSFHDESCELHYDYATVLDWFINEAECQEDNDPEDEGLNYNDLKGQLEEQLKFGEQLHAVMLDKGHLTEFASRLEAFTPQNEEQETLLTLARRFYDLYQRFPERTFHARFEDPSDMIDPDWEVSIGHHRSVAMIWDFDDVYEQVEQHLNCDLENAALFCEPLDIRTHQTGAPIDPHELDYEDLFFPLLSDLIDHVLEA